MLEEKTSITAELRQVLKTNELDYRKCSQIAYYCNLQNIDKMEVFTKSFLDVECNQIFCCHGDKYSPDHKEDIYYFIVRTLDEQLPKLKKLYSLVYIYHSMKDFLFFKSIIQRFPETYLSKMKHIYIVNSGLRVKVMEKLSFGLLNNFILGKVVHIEKIEQIQQSKKVVINSKLKLHYTELPTTDFGNKIIENKLYGRKISQYQLSKFGIPIVIEQLISKLLSKPSYLLAEGIMRKSCSVQWLQVLEGHLFQDETSINYLVTLEDPYVVSGCLRKIFNNLSVPLFSYQIYDKIIEYRPMGEQADEVQFVKDCLSLMKDIQINVLFYLIGFLKMGIVQNSTENKMSSYNLAVVFGPCLFRPLEYKVEDLLNSGKFSKIIMTLIDHFGQVAGPQKQSEIYTRMRKKGEEFGN